MNLVDMVSVLPFLELRVAVVSALPVSELRGGIPLAFYYGFDPFKAYFISIIGNLVPVPFLLIFLEKMRKLALRWGWTSTIYLFFEKRAERRKGVIEKFGYPGLIFFVAIPLPVTGAWTGSLVSFLLRLKPMRSFFFIAIGVLIAGVVVTAAVMGVFSIVSLIGVN
ncbi:MAG: small multi-drug export protein [Archaeoglobaceae archaeon]